MGWLDRLRGKVTGTDPSAARTDDENASRSDAGAGSAHAPAEPRRERIQRAPRARVIELLNVHFVFEDDGAPSGRVGIVNLSTTGTGLIRRSSPEWPVPGSIVRGELDFSGSRIPVTLKLVQTAGDVIGAAYVDPSPELREKIQRYFEIELSALAMNTTPSAMLQEEPRGEPHWLHGANNCELFYVADGNELLRFNLSFFGNYIESEDGERTRYGHVIEDDQREKPRYKGSAMIRWQPAMPPEMKETALRFLANVPNLTPELRKSLAERIGVVA